MTVMATARATAAGTYAHITKDPKVCGGRACIDNTRIRVIDIVGLQRSGMKPEKMLNMYSAPLTLAQVHAALAYAYDHPDEIEADLRKDDETAEQMDRDREEYLKRHSGR